MNRLGFRACLIAVVVLSLILSLSVVSYLSYNLIKEQVENNLISDLSNIVDEESTKILNKLDYTEASVASLAELYTQGALPISEIPAALVLSAKASNVAKFTLGFDDGSSYVSSPSRSFPGGVGILSKYDPRTRDWYKVGKQNIGSSLSAPFFTSTGALIMLVMHSVENGVLSADIRFSNLSSELNAIKEERGMDAFIVTDSGLILASTSTSVVETENIFESQDRNFFSRVIKDTSSEIKYEYEYNNVNTLFLKKTIELSDGNKWYLLLAVDKEIAYMPVQEATMTLLTVNIITAIASVLALLFIMKLIYSPILSLRHLITDLSQGNGDLTQRLEVKSDDDIGQIAIGINKFIEQLQSMMLEVKKSTEQFTGRVDKIYLQSEQNATVLSQHALETEQIVAAVEELSSSAVVVADNSSSAASSAQDANTNSKNANDVLRTTQEQINALASEIIQASDNVKLMDEKTGDIQSIVEVIGGIAEQTNLLALNASIEAARAGEQGRGFAVVADEVRALANRTQNSTTEIGDAITALQKEASGVVASISGTKVTCDVTVERAESVSELLQALSDHISGISNMNSEISSSAEEQNTVIQTVSKNITELHQMVEKLSSIAQTQYDEVNSIAKINENLSNIIGKFKL